MDMKTKATFEQTAANVLARAESVECESENYVEGLRISLIKVNECYEMSCEEFGVEF